MIPPIDFKNILNPSQYEAVTTLEGPLLVVAGAGTGKTRVIEYRVLNLILNNVNPSSILLLTFTRKSAREMIERASRHNQLCQKVEGGTFHSFAYKIIISYRKHLGFNDSISFIDESDSADALNLLVTKLKLSENRKKFPKKDTLKNIISISINRSIDIPTLLKKDYPHFTDLSEDIKKLHKAYIEYKTQKGLIDYDDMLIYLKFLLEKEEILQTVSSKLKYVMVDEFQDTNKLQAEIIYLLSKTHQNVMVVGDDAQSIYSFRGAYYKNMFDFPNRFSNCKILKLENNYRSTQPILDVANLLLKDESNQYTKSLLGIKGKGQIPELLFFKDTYKEAEYIAGKIKELHNKGANLSSIGVLYRSNHVSLTLQIALSKMNIPFNVFGGLRFTETAHIKDMLVFTRVLQNRHDELAWHRILLMLEGVGIRNAERIYQNIAIHKTLESAFEEFYPNPVIGRGLRRLEKLFRDIKTETLDIHDTLNRVKEYYYPIMKDKFDDYHLRNDDLKALIQISEEYTTIENFLVDFVVLEPPQRNMLAQNQKNNDETPVTLSTIHSAKGLEWEIVFIISLIDGCLPVSYALADEEGLQEEKRLLYVAITRAKSQLFLSMHNQGQSEDIFSFTRLSRFINEKSILDKLLIDYKKFGIEEAADINTRTSGSSLQRMYDYFDY